MTDALRDARFGLRVLGRNPGFTAVAMLSLALGIGVNTAVFTIADAILLKPLPVARAEGLVSLYHHIAEGGWSSSSWPDYELYRDHNQVFTGMSAYLRVPMVVRTREAAEEVRGELVSGNYFSVLGVQAVRGRALSERDTGDVAVLSYAYWQRRFGGDPRVIGRIVAIGGRDFTLIGVAPRAFRGVVMDWGGPPDLWVPVTCYREAVPALARLDLQRDWRVQSFLVFGRLRPGVTLERARANLAVLSAQAAPLRDQALKRRLPFKAALIPVQQGRFWPAYRGRVTQFLAVLASVAALVLLIACANVANLLVALTSNRRKETLVRLALGVSRGRLLRQLLAESLTLSILSGAIGLAVAAWTMRFLTGFPGAIGAPLVLEIGLDARAFGWAFLISAISALLFGLAPALKADPSALGTRRISLRNGLIAAQVALSLVVLIGAGLFARTLRNAMDEDVTSNPASLLLARIEPASWGYNEARTKALYQQLLDRVRSLAGVPGAALVSTVPLSGMRSEAEIAVGDSPPARVNVNVISDGYFAVAGLPVLRGREFTGSDREGVPFVAVLNEQAAARLWPGEEPLGKRFRLAGRAGDVEVIGVVRDGRFRRLRDPLQPCVYLPLSQAFRPGINLEVRTAGEPLRYVEAIRSELRSLDRELPLTGVMSWAKHRHSSLAQERLAAALVSILGALVLALAAMGVSGVVSFVVASRTREIGIRMALGASRAGIARAALMQGIAPVLAGLLIGAGAALYVTRFIASLLYGVAPVDGPTFAAASLLLLAVSAVAGYLPARRAAKLDPMQALHHD